MTQGTGQRGYAAKMSGGGGEGEYECIAVLQGHSGDVKCIRFAPSQGQWGDGKCINFFFIVYRIDIKKKCVRAYHQPWMILFIYYYL